MTNREKVLADFAKMSDFDFGEVVCNAYSCPECPAMNGRCRGMVGMIEWLNKEADSDGNSRDFDF